jgi:uncharacterized protein YegL
MGNKHQVHNLIILDESGSMRSIKESIIAGFNELVNSIHGIETQFPDQEHFITFISFNGQGQKLHHLAEPAASLKTINDKNYFPQSTTPLFDAIGFAVQKLEHVLRDVDDYNVLVTILTDGEENSSKEFTGPQIKSLVEEFIEKRWTFTYIGTDHDVEKIAASLAIKNVMKFKKNAMDIGLMFDMDRKARAEFSQKIYRKDDVSTNYFK